MASGQNTGIYQDDTNSSFIEKFHVTFDDDRKRISSLCILVLVDGEKHFVKCKIVSINSEDHFHSRFKRLSLTQSHLLLPPQINVWVGSMNFNCLGTSLEIQFLNHTYRYFVDEKQFKLKNIEKEISEEDQQEDSDISIPEQVIVSPDKNFHLVPLSSSKYELDGFSLLVFNPKTHALEQRFETMSIEKNADPTICYLWQDGNQTGYRFSRPQITGDKATIVEFSAKKGYYKYSFAIVPDW